MSLSHADPTFAQAAPDWLDSRKPYISPRTAHDYAFHIKTLTNYFGEMRLAAISADDVRTYQRIRMRRAGASVINHEGSVLQQVLKRYGRWRDIADHYEALPLPKESPHRALTQDEERRLHEIGATSQQWDVAYYTFVISINTTAGPGEIRHVRLKDIQLDHPSGPQFRVQPEGAKNAGRVRVLPVNAETVAAFQYLIARAARLGSTQPDHYLLPYRICTGTYDPNKPARSWRTALDGLLAACSINVSAYSFRHHAITKLLENPDVSEETVEAIAGHVSHRIKRRYSHIRIEHKRAAIAALGRVQSEPASVCDKPSLTNGDVMEMLKGLPPQIVVAKIKSGPCRFNTLPDTLKQLKASGVPDTVILEMVRAS